MHIDDSLGLVVPIRDDGLGISAYHMPISRHVYEANFRLLSHVKSDLAQGGVYYQMEAGPRVAALLVRDRARAEAELLGQTDASGKPSAVAADALFAEIKRLTTILSPGPDGWETLPVDSAISKGILSAPEWEEALSDIVFFTCHYAMARLRDRKSVADAISSLLKASVTPLPILEYVASLTTSTQDAPSLPKAASSVPS